MASKKQFADMENTILLLEEKVEKLEDDNITMKQMISMQNALIDNLQMMIKMMSQQTLTMSVKGPIGNLHHDSIMGGGHKDAHDDVQREEPEEDVIVSKQQKQGGLKHRMSRVA